MLDSRKLGQHQILEPNLPKIIWMTKTFEKMYIRIVLSI